MDSTSTQMMSDLLKLWEVLYTLSHNYVTTKHLTGDDCQLLMAIFNLLPGWLSFSNFNRTLKFCIIKSYTWIHLKKVFPFLPKVTKESEFSGSPVTSRASCSQHILNKCAFLVDEWHFSFLKKMNYSKKIWGLHCARTLFSWQWFLGGKNTWNGSIQLGKLQATLRGDHWSPNFSTFILRNTFFQLK